MVERFDVFLVNLDPQPSADPKNTRPCVIISPDELNRNLENVIVASLSSTELRYPTRVLVNFLNAERSVILDQIRTVDKQRLVKKIGSIGKDAQNETIKLLQELFAD